jgi:hypothetical protein
MRRIPRDKALEVVRRRLRGETVPAISAGLKLPRSTVYNILNLSQEVADMEFVEELEGELEKLYTLYYEGGEGFINVSEGAGRLAKALSRYILLPQELVAQAILNAHWRRMNVWRRRGS